MPRKLPASKLRSLEKNMDTTEGYRAFVAWTTLEEDFQNQVLALAGPLGWELTYHTHDSRRSNGGFPDLVMASERRGRVVFLELKAEGEKPPADQIRWAETLTACGQEHHFLWPSDMHNGRVEEILR